jgi:sigma-B regulation protein RsbU (phosphoserine phosphatase)
LAKLPATPADLDWAGLLRPAEKPTGDYFEHMKLPSGEIAFAIGEAGHGLQAVSAVACMRGCIRAALRNGSVEPMQVADDLNRILYELYPCEAFATLFYGQYHPGSRVLRYVNAGHEQPMLVQRNGGRALRLERYGAPLGLREDSRYRQSSVQLRPGDRVVAFTLGVLEGLAEHEERGADAALTDVIQRCQERSSWEVAECILERCARTSMPADRTVLVASPVDKAKGVMYAVDVQEVCALA